MTFLALIGEPCPLAVTTLATLHGNHRVWYGNYFPLLAVIDIQIAQQWVVIVNYVSVSANHNEIMYSVYVSAVSE